VALLLAPPPAKAVLFTVTFDENGLGLIANTEHTFLPSANMLDPFDPGNGLLPLVYDFGIRNPGLTNGDVLIQQVAGGPVSDLFRFWNNPDTHHQWGIFYSDIDDRDTHPDKADVGIPDRMQTNTLVLTETIIPGGENGAQYLAAFGSGLPGASLVSGQDALIRIFSETPEPSTLAISGLGALGLIAYRLRRRR
jgi:hypothetical protein